MRIGSRTGSDLGVRRIQTRFVLECSIASNDGHSLLNAEMKTIEVSAGLVFRANKLLITQRHADAHLGGLWEFPGGKREPGETFELCLVRELRERGDGCGIEEDEEQWNAVHHLGLARESRRVARSSRGSLRTFSSAQSDRRDH